MYGYVRLCAVQCGAVRCSAVRCGAVRCGAVRCGAVARYDRAKAGVGAVQRIFFVFVIVFVFVVVFVFVFAFDSKRPTIGVRCNRCPGFREPRNKPKQALSTTH